jgi:hypothetical protein
MDSKARAYAIERRYRMLTTPWREIVTEIRSERGALLGASRFDDLSGVEKATALDNLDSRLRTAEDWLNHYDKERNKTSFRLRRLLKQAALMTDNELEGEL